jgi:succinate dehydrogenase / fumarate reductase flavoprotein subunit
LVVFGKRAGKAAAEHSSRVQSGALDSAHLEEAEREMLAPFERTDGEFPYEIHRDLQETMQSLVGIFRNEGDLQKALGELEKFKHRLEHVRADGSRMFNPGWHLTRDLRSMVLISEAVTRSALARRESRGAHSRIDYPNFDDAWGKQNNIIVNRGDTMTLEQRPVTDMPNELKEILAENK